MGDPPGQVRGKLRRRLAGRHPNGAVQFPFNIDGADWRWHQFDDNQSAYDSSQHHWIAALAGKVELMPTAEVALQTMLVSEGIYLSDRLGREVTAEEVVATSRSSAEGV